MIGKVLGIMTQPAKTWADIGNLTDQQIRPYVLYPAILALIPAFAWYYGTTHFGWSIGDDGDVTRLTKESARDIAVLYYFTQIISIWIIGYTIHWMSKTYGAHSTVLRGIIVSGFTATPVLLAGLSGFLPWVALDLLILLGAAAYAVYLLYTGIPIAMGVPADRGFFYASAIIAVILVMIVGIISATLILWDMGFAPVFTD